MKLVVLQAGEVAAGVAERRGQYPALIAETVGAAWSGEWETVDLRASTALPEPRSAAGFVITGSSASVTERADWMLRAEEYIRTLAAADAPIFGICFGHQLVAQALGGEVQRNPYGREIGTVPALRVSEEDLLRGLPETFLVNATHVDTVARLPPGAKVLATTERDRVAAYALGGRIFGAQFHPEIDAEVMRLYVRARASQIQADGLDVESIYQSVQESEHNGEVLRNFVRYVVCAVARP